MVGWGLFSSQLKISSTDCLLVSAAGEGQVGKASGKEGPHSCELEAAAEQELFTSIPLHLLAS
jgi:hypothetical protein